MIGIVAGYIMVFLFGVCLGLSTAGSLMAAGRQNEYEEIYNQLMIKEKEENVLEEKVDSKDSSEDSEKHNGFLYSGGFLDDK